ncbi:sporulation phosphorelay system protein KapB [Virgibacillus sp. W0430]|uniref:sporulation phosphorelay system protein KapB n=1 Tax=Virgibacillus sp. W0430 TaxID=3391580 RepID=UPI003F47CCA7
MANINIGDVVEASYNSGSYIGKVLEDRRNFYLVKVLAVVKHPQQGDLHNPGKVDGVAFHERKALAFTEKMNVAKRKVVPYVGEIPDYKQSLKEAIADIKQELHHSNTDYSKAALQKLSDLEMHFYNKLF